MSDINVTVQDEIVEIDVIDTPVYVDVINSPGAAGPAGPGVAVGGTAGQILAKASSTNYDTEWINNYAKYLATNVRNQTGSTIPAFRVVYISGATGNKPLVSLADADTEATSSKTYGVTAVSIANNGTGDVVTAGELSGIDTSAFNEGDSLWLSSTAGQVQTTPPAEPAHAVFIGTVVRSHPTLGVIDVAIQNGYELTELHGVEITSAANNDGLFYNGSLWVNKSILTVLGYTPANAATTLTINGVTYDLSANRSWTISAGISGSGSSGQVTYWTGASAVSGSNNLFWDNTNARLGIGTNAPGVDLDIRKASVGATGSVLARIQDTNAQGEAYLTVLNDQSEYCALENFGSLFGNTSLRRQSTITASNLNGFSFILLNNSTTAHLSFKTTISQTERFRLFGNTGNVLIQNGGTFTDNGARLQVSGDVFIKGSGSTSSTTALTVQDSNGTNIFRVQNDQATIFSVGSYFLTDTNLIVDRTATDGISMRFRIGSGSNVGGLILTHGGSFTKTTGISKALSVEHNFAPTSGSAQFTGLNFSPTINQTGGANGITRGLYVNPTLTSAADFRAIETARGNIVFANLPTSSAGLPSGALWNNGGVINIV